MLKKKQQETTIATDCNEWLTGVIEFYADDVPKFIRPVTADELSDPTKHFHKQTEDFIYPKLPPGVIMAFLSTVRKRSKGTGKTRSYTHIRKFYDAILFGAREQGTSLPSEPIDFHQY